MCAPSPNLQTRAPFEKQEPPHLGVRHEGALRRARHARTASLGKPSASTLPRRSWKRAASRLCSRHSVISRG
eukprot:11185164-Alexandrium_andersonii.AAC.1